MLNYDLKMIKDKYGEKMMHLCRTLFPSLLEHEGLLFKIMSEHFDYNRSLYYDIVSNYMEEEFKNYIYSFIDVERTSVTTTKTPQELLDEAGYILYECHTEEEIQAFKKYYREDEVLCTFTFGNRLERCHVFFAVKKDVDSIKREDFDDPKREDAYGTSVISIQFTKGFVNTVSIKNRYNHTVNNPDATYGNNLENIIPGLTDAFEKKYGYNIYQTSRAFDLRNYVKANDGKFYKYNCEINNVYYCNNNVIIDNFEVKRYDKAKYIITDYFIIDKVNKRIDLYDKNLTDSFIDSVGSIEKIEEIPDKSTGGRTVVINGKILLKLDRDNKLIGYTNNAVNEIGDSFLSNNRWLKEINIPNVIKIGNYFLDRNNSMTSFSAHRLREVGDFFMERCSSLTDIDLPNVLKIGKYCLTNCKIDSLSLPNVRVIGDYFMFNNFHLAYSLSLPNVEVIGHNFLEKNNSIMVIDMPNVRQIGNGFMRNNEVVKKINMPNVISIGHFFMGSNFELEEISLEKVESVGMDFLRENKKIKIVNLPSVKEIGDDFLYQNNSLEFLNLPNAEFICANFLAKCNSLIKVDLPKVKTILRNFMRSASKLEEISLPEVEKIEDIGFLDSSSGDCLKSFYAPKYNGDVFDKIIGRTYHVISM